LAGIEPQILGDLTNNTLFCFGEAQKRYPINGGYSPP